MNLPNKITLARVALVPVFAVLLLLDEPIYQLAATIVFLIASLTDMLDGYIARSRNMITDFGKFMDPIADKLLVMAAVVGLCSMGRLPAWAAMVMLGREFVVSGVRLVAASKGVVMAAGKLGKYKTTAQMIALPVLMLSTGALPVFPWLHVPGQIILYISVALSIWSLIDYIYKNREVISE